MTVHERRQARRWRRLVSEGQFSSHQASRQRVCSRRRQGRRKHKRMHARTHTQGRGHFPKRVWNKQAPNCLSAPAESAVCRMCAEAERPRGSACCSQSARQDLPVLCHRTSCSRPSNHHHTEQEVKLRYGPTALLTKSGITSCCFAVSVN